MIRSGLVVTDLDGTLLGSDRTVSPPNRETLERLSEEGVVRVVATGRSWFSARAVLPPSFPIDYLVFSAGVGVVDWRRQAVVRRSDMRPAQLARALEALAALELDCMIHEPLPDNHRFHYFKHSAEPNPDFERRVGRYREHARAGEAGGEIPAGSQVVAISPRADASIYLAAASAVPELEVVRSTSPLDGESMWIEVYPPGVSKSSAAEWIAKQLGLSRSEALSIGNDYNDIDLLDWGGTAYVVANAPPELIDAYEVVPSNDEHGFSEAVARWRGAT